MLRGRVGHGAFAPDSRLTVISTARGLPEEHGCSATRWSLDEIAASILNQNAAEAMSRSTIWRILDNLTTDWSLDVCRVVAKWCDVAFVQKQLQRAADRHVLLTDPSHEHVLHFAPKHGSWANQVELWFGVLERRFLRRGEFRSGEEVRTETPGLSE